MFDYQVSSEDVKNENGRWRVSIANKSFSRKNDKMSLSAFCDAATGYFQSALTDDAIYEYIICSRWSSLNQRCSNGLYTTASTSQFKSYRNKQILLNMTKVEFTNWMLAQKPVYDSLKNKGEIPSIDRIDPNGDYELSNIQIISLHENLEKRSGKSCRRMTNAEKELARERNRSNYLKNKEAAERGQNP